MNNDWYYMQRCLTLAQQAKEKGNSAVGAVLVKDDQIITEAEEAVNSMNDIVFHAELQAVRLAVETLKTKDLSGCILYTTHEPCVMCSFAIRFYKIQKVVYLHQSAHLGGVSSSLPMLTTRDVPYHWNDPPIIIQLKNE